MEEVIGSIPIRSTNKPHNLADSQKNAIGFRYVGLVLHPPQHFLRHSLMGRKNIDHPALRLALG
jgi:hypothetical protein